MTVAGPWWIISLGSTVKLKFNICMTVAGPWLSNSLGSTVNCYSLLLDKKSQRATRIWV